MDIAFAMELLFQVVPPDDSQVVRVPAMGLDHEPTSAIGPIDVEDRVIHSVEVCCCGPEEDHADGRMNGLEMSLYDEAHRRAPGLEVESVVWTLCVGYFASEDQVGSKPYALRVVRHARPEHSNNPQEPRIRSSVHGRSTCIPCVS